MKNSFCIFRFTLLFVLLICILALCSWIGSIYDVGEVQSLLGTEGVRWILGHVAEDYVKEPALRNVRNRQNIMRMKDIFIIKWNWKKDMRDGHRSPYSSRNMLNNQRFRYP